MARPKKTKPKKNKQPATESTGGKLRRLLLDFYTGETVRFVPGMLILIATVVMLLAFVSIFATGALDQTSIESGDLRTASNYGGTLGARMADYFVADCFGLTAFFIPAFLLLLSMKLMGAYRIRLWKWFLNFTVLMVWGSVALDFASEHLIPVALLENFVFPLGGGHGQYICRLLENTIGLVGTFCLLIGLAVFYFIYLSRETMRIVRNILHPKLPRRKEKDADAEVETREEEDAPADEPNEDHKVEFDFGTEVGDEALALDLGGDAGDEAKDAGSRIEIEDTRETDTELTIEETGDEAKAEGKTVEDAADDEPYDPKKDLEYYRYPTLDLLKRYADNGPTIDMTEQHANKDRIISVLKSFGVEISTIKATIGPTITLYEITLAEGVRVSKVRNLQDDIALSLSAIGIRIIAPIPGKGTIGIEVPNKNPKIVSMESILNSKKFQETTFDLPIALGKTITNEVFMVDLVKMPHLLVAGATGQGKSVGLNAIITSLIYKRHPAELKFVMVDPKKVEFSVYSPLEKYFLAKVPGEDEAIITDVQKVIATLKSLCQLMDHRYDLLKKAKVRNIKEYNERFKARRLSPTNGHDFMPYIVVIIDEFGDLIMTAGKEVELPIARIAQLARAVGIHMVIATQRPTVNIITGTIKANFPGRVAFRVSAAVDSKTILDRTGADQLIGRGDMLFLNGNEPVRVQCAFVDTPEVERINAFISEQQGYLSAFLLPEVVAESDGEGLDANISSDQLDPMMRQVASFVVTQQQGSTSAIQRKFSIGYNRAGRLMDQLERLGVVGPAQGSKPREVLIADEISLENILNNLK